MVDIFFSSEGIDSSDLDEQRAANLAISSAMADAPTSIYPALHSALTKAVDHKEHDAVSTSEVKIFYTPAGNGCMQHTCSRHTRSQTANGMF